MAGRRKWVTRPIQQIRIPAPFASLVEQIATLLDQEPGIQSFTVAVSERVYDEHGRLINLIGEIESHQGTQTTDQLEQWSADEKDGSETLWLSPEQMLVNALISPRFRKWSYPTEDLAIYSDDEGEEDQHQGAGHTDVVADDYLIDATLDCETVPVISAPGAEAIPDPEQFEADGVFYQPVAIDRVAEEPPQPEIVEFVVICQEPELLPVPIPAIACSTIQAKGSISPNPDSLKLADPLVGAAEENSEANPDPSEAGPDEIMAAVDHQSEPAIDLPCLDVPREPAAADQPEVADQTYQFGCLLYQAWRHLTEHSGTVSWGQPVALETLYRHSFAAMMGHEFVYQVGQALRHSQGSEIRAALISGENNLDIDGQLAEFITYWDTSTTPYLTIEADTSEDQHLPAPAEVIHPIPNEPDELNRLRAERQQHLDSVRNQSARPDKRKDRNPGTKGGWRWLFSW